MVTRYCPTQLHWKSIDVVKLNASNKYSSAVSLSTARSWLSAVGGEAWRCLQDLKQARCSKQVFICQAGITISSSPELSKSLAWKFCPFGIHTLCYTVLCWSDFPGLETDLLLLGPKAVPVDTQPCPSAQRHPVMWVPAALTTVCFSGGILRTAMAPSVLKEKERTTHKAGAWSFASENTKLRKRLSSFSVPVNSYNRWPFLFFLSLCKNKKVLKQNAHFLYCSIHCHWSKLKKQEKCLNHYNPTSPLSFFNLHRFCIFPTKWNNSWHDIW